jgi:hypothetical protein
MGNSDSGVTWELNSDTMLVLSQSPIWISFVKDLGAPFSSDPLTAAYDIFETRLQETGITWHREEDVLADLFMNMGGGIPHEVLTEVRRCAQVVIT